VECGHFSAHIRWPQGTLQQLFTYDDPVEFNRERHDVQLMQIIPTLSTSPLEISPTAGEIPHFHSPTTKADGKVENQMQVFHFPTATISLISEPLAKLKHEGHFLFRGGPLPA